MSEIKKGDLVMVLRDHACTPRAGHIHTVVEIVDHCVRCRSCGLVQRGLIARLDATPTHGAPWVGLPPSWLKKIDPPATGDEVSTRKTIREKAKA